MLTPDATRFVGAPTFSALASEPVRTSLFGRRRSHSAHHARPAGRSRGRVPGHRSGHRRVCRWHLQRPAHRHPARHPSPRRRLPRHAHRDVGAPRGAGQPAASRQPGCGSSPRGGPLAGGDSGTGRLADPATSSPQSRRCSVPRDWPVSTCSSPPAAPGSRSIPCASSATGRRASRATPWPRRPSPRGPRSPWSRPPSAPVPPSGRGPGRHRGRDGAGGAGRRSAADVVVMAAAVADFRPQAAAGRSRRPRGCRRSSSSRPRTSWRRWAAEAPAQTLVGFAAETERRPGPRQEKLTARASISSSPTTCQHPERGFEHDTNQVTIVSAGAGWPRWRWPTSEPSPPRCRRHRGPPPSVYRPRPDPIRPRQEPA